MCSSKWAYTKFSQMKPHRQEQHKKEIPILMLTTPLGKNMPTRTK
jgi:hypothetical protein